MNTGQAYVAAGGDPNRLTERPTICRDYRRNADGTCYRNGQLEVKQSRYSMPLYEGPWGWLYWLLDRRGK